MRDLSVERTRAIEERYARALAHLPGKKQAVEGFLAGCDAEQTLCLRFLYGSLPLSDVLTFEPEELNGYVTAALKARKHLPWGRTVPQELFFNYILMPRVNNEHPDGSRELLQSALWDRVQGKTMTEAALEVNYWCYAHATYHPSDDRTLGPLGVLRGTLGRCGEESTFAVCALRSVGLPARQCYVPRWSHCDDNHAWVEFWAEGKWHYLGACEPEPVADKGWFTAAASRAMVVHSRAFSTLVTEETAVHCSGRATLIHSTGAYAPCVDLTLWVTEGGAPAPGVHIQFQVVNDSRCCTVYETHTDDGGRAVFRTGRGGLRLLLCHRGKLLARALDTRNTQEMTLDLQDARTPAQLDGTAEAFSLTPPAEHISEAPSAPPPQSHLARLADCEAHRKAYHQTFSPALPLAKGNRREVERFLQDPRFDREAQTELLSTLRPKDWLDCTCDMLTDALLCARPYRDRFDRETYRAYILTPRVAHEMLLPVRRALLAQVPEDITGGRALLDWLKGRVRTVPDGDLPPLTPDCAKALRQGCTNQSAFGVLFVNLCRAKGIPARQNPHTLAYEWLEDGRFCPMDGDGGQALSLELRNDSGGPLAYGGRFTLSRFRQGRYEALAFPGLVLEDRAVLQAPPGDYALVTTTRQIDGTVSTRIRYISLRRESALPVTLPEDRTAHYIRRVTLTPPAGTVQSQLAALTGPAMILFLEPGKEPTEHLLQEVLECREDCIPYELLLFTLPDADAQNPTLQRVLTALPHARLTEADPAGLEALRRQMGVGDERLPFALALDDRGRGLYACANYNIGACRTLLHIQNLADQKEHL